MISPARFLLGALLFQSIFPLEAQVDWPALRLVQVTTNVSNPVHITHAGDGSGRLFIVERPGLVKVLDPGATEPRVFLDIRQRVTWASQQETGLLSIAFPFDYPSQKCFYVFYTMGPAAISRFRVTGSPEVADARSEEVLLLAYADRFHVGGQLAFGPDGFLYIGVGDARRNPSPAQDPGWHPGKILRIDVNSAIKYRVPSSNPFVGNLNFWPEIWAVGLRNPWRFSFDRLTGDLFISDVGEASSEEINLVPAGSAGGMNFGWPYFEGTRQFYATNVLPANVTKPILEFGRTNGVAIIGGFVYRGPDSPRMNGLYFFADIIGLISAAQKTAEGWVTSPLANLPDSSVTSFGEDEQGRLYLCSTLKGIFRLEDAMTTAPPQFSPHGLMAPWTDQVTIVAPTPGAMIRYTTNGVDPDDSLPLEPSGISVKVTEGVTLKAVAYREGLAPSAVQSRTFRAVQPAPVEFDPPGGIVRSNVWVTLHCATPGATIAFGTNTGTPFTYSGPFLVGPGTTVRAVPRLNGVSPEFTTRTQTYVPASELLPVVTPPGGLVPPDTMISIEWNQNPAATIRYTLNGGTPTAASPAYTSPIAISQNTDLKLRAFENDVAITPLQSFQFITTIPFVEFNTPSSFAIQKPILVVLRNPLTEGAIHYTVDGSDPTTASPSYTSPLTIPPGTTVKAIIVVPNFPPGPISTRTYAVLPITTPTFIPLRGPVTNGTLVRMQTTPYDARIHYTLDGTEPTENSPTYSAPIPLTRPVQIRARGFGDGMVPSQIRDAFFSVYPEYEVSTALNSLQVSKPTALAIGPDGDLYVYSADTQRLQLVRQNNQTEDLPSPGAIEKIAVDAQGYVYATLIGAHQVFKWIPGAAGFETFAGSATAGTADGAGNEAQFDTPQHLEIAPNGDLIVSQPKSIRRVQPNGFVTTLTVFAQPEIPANGQVSGIGILPNGEIWSSITPLLFRIGSDNAVSLFAGKTSGFSDGPRDIALIEICGDLTVDRLGRTYFIDRHRIRQIDGSGLITTIAGSDSPDFVDGPAYLARFKSPAAIAVTQNGVIYVADSGNSAVRKLIPKDWDADGVPDATERAHPAYQIGADDRAIDSDGDGIANAFEYLAGTNPSDAQSRFEIVSGERIRNGTALRLEWRSVPGRKYRVQWSADLQAWTDWPEILTGSDALSAIEDSVDSAPRFYRIVVLPADG
jgi:glucose/arabinose dehydrogenase